MDVSSVHLHTRLGDYGFALGASWILALVARVSHSSLQHLVVVPLGRLSKGGGNATPGHSGSCRHGFCPSCDGVRRR